MREIDFCSRPAASIASVAVSATRAPIACASLEERSLRRSAGDSSRARTITSGTERYALREPLVNAARTMSAASARPRPPRPAGDRNPRHHAQTTPSIAIRNPKYWTKKENVLGIRNSLLPSPPKLSPTNPCVTLAAASP